MECQQRAYETMKLEIQKRMFETVKQKKFPKGCFNKGTRKIGWKRHNLKELICAVEIWV